MKPVAPVRNATAPRPRSVVAPGAGPLTPGLRGPRTPPSRRRSSGRLRGPADADGLAAGDRVRFGDDDIDLAYAREAVRPGAAARRPDAEDADHPLGAIGATQADGAARPQRRARRITLEQAKAEHAATERDRDDVGNTEAGDAVGRCYVSHRSNS